MKISIIGGGNVGLLMAAEFAGRGHSVTMYTSKPYSWTKKLEVYDADDRLLFTGELDRITDSIEEAVKEAECVWVVTPAQVLKSIAEKMLPYARPGLLIGFAPGSGGAEFAFRKLIEKGCTLFGLQRVHSIARLKEYGKSGYMLGRKPGLELGSIPASAAEDLCNMVSDLFDMPCRALENYLSVTLTPSNPILHTTRLYSMFKDYRDGMVYPKNILFYEEWTDHASEMLLACDSELQKLCGILPLELSDVMSLRDYYESQTVPEMTHKISNIKAFKGLTSPMKKIETGWIPDFTSRYFTADFPFGLKIIKDIAGLFEVETPGINTVWDWFMKTAMLQGTDMFELDIERDKFAELYR